jgi:hypothetical protein
MLFGTFLHRSGCYPRKSLVQGRGSPKQPQEHFTSKGRGGKRTGGSASSAPDIFFLESTGEFDGAMEETLGRVGDVRMRA